MGGHQINNERELMPTAMRAPRAGVCLLWFAGLGSDVAEASTGPDRLNVPTGTSRLTAVPTVWSFLSNVVSASSRDEEPYVCGKSQRRAVSDPDGSTRS